MFNSPAVDPQLADIIVSPNVRVIYTGSDNKLSEHGGFAHDDTSVIMLVSISPRPRDGRHSSRNGTDRSDYPRSVRVGSGRLQSVQQEGTQVLPGLPFGSDD